MVSNQPNISSLTLTVLEQNAVLTLQTGGVFQFIYAKQIVYLASLAPASAPKKVVTSSCLQDSVTRAGQVVDFMLFFCRFFA